MLRLLDRNGLVASATLLIVASYGLLLSQLDPGLHLLPIAAAVFAAALVSSVAGFAFSAICGAMLFHIVDEAVLAVQIMMICSIAGQSYMVWWLRRQIAWQELPVFLLGAAAGLPFGLWILLEARSFYAHGVGLLLVSYAGFMLLRPATVVPWRHPGFDALAGFLGGITGGAAAFPGAFVTIWCGLKGWTKDRQRAVYQPFILITQVAGFLLLLMVHPASGQRLSIGLESVASLPAMLLGTTAGLALYRRLGDRPFATAVNLLLFLSGLSLLL